MLTIVNDFYHHFTKHIPCEQKFSAEVTQNIQEIHTVLTHTSLVHSILLLTDITSTNKTNLFSLTQNRFISIQVVTLTYLLHILACT